MNDKKRPTATEGSTDAVMPNDVASLAETGKDAKKSDGQQNLKKEVDEATDLPQKGSA